MWQGNLSLKGITRKSINKIVLWWVERVKPDFPHCYSPSSSLIFIMTHTSPNTFSSSHHICLWPVEKTSACVRLSSSWLTHRAHLTKVGQATQKNTLSELTNSFHFSLTIYRYLWNFQNHFYCKTSACGNYGWSWADRSHVIRDWQCDCVSLRNQRKRNKNKLHGTQHALFVISALNEME